MTPAQRIRFRAVHLRTIRAMSEVAWCCGAHEMFTGMALGAQAQAFARLGANDAVGYRALLAEAETLAATVESLTILMHPRVNVRFSGDA
jgi:hypothetical protein